MMPSSILPLLASAGVVREWDLTGATVLWNAGVVMFFVLLNGFFVAAEFAIVKVRDSQLQEAVDEGSSNARFAQRLTKHLDCLPFGDAARHHPGEHRAGHGGGALHRPHAPTAALQDGHRQRAVGAWHRAGSGLRDHHLPPCRARRADSQVTGHPQGLQHHPVGEPAAASFLPRVQAGHLRAQRHRQLDFARGLPSRSRGRERARPLRGGTEAHRLRKPAFRGGDGDGEAHRAQCARSQRPLCARRDDAAQGRGLAGCGRHVGGQSQARARFQAHPLSAG